MSSTFVYGKIEIIVICAEMVLQGLVGLKQLQYSTTISENKVSVLRNEHLEN
jgi:hypothetical protein